MRDGLRTGPVLIQVPRRGYAPRLACERCRTPARCRHCAGPLEAPDQQDLNCAWCGQAERAWSCAECGSTRLRARIVGARRTAEELGRAFPAVPVRTSGRDHILDAVPDAPALVVSTPGAEPVAEGGYAAALLLDGWAMLGRPDLRAGEEALRRWLAASALVRGQEEGGTVVVVAEPTERAVQALVRWDPAGFARRELAERAELGFPPVSRMASVTGPPEALAAFLQNAGLPPEAEILGPVPAPSAAPGRARRPGDAPPGETWERVLIRVVPGRGAALARALKTALAARTAKGASEPIRIRIDPPTSAEPRRSRRGPGPECAGAAYGLGARAPDRELPRRATGTVGQKGGVRSAVARARERAGAQLLTGRLRGRRRLRRHRAGRRDRGHRGAGPLGGGSGQAGADGDRARRGGVLAAPSAAGCGVARRVP